MNPKHKNTLLVTAIASGLLSLPMTWMTIRNAEMRFKGGLEGLFDSALQGMTLDVTGLNGYATLLFKTPLWFVVLVAIAANAIQLIRSSDKFTIPKTSFRIAAFGATIWVTIPMVNVLLTGDATPGIGWFLAIFCAVAPLVCHFVPDTKAPSGG